jgi:1,4-dihydroxy-2-naphthoate octaprenyltransferase/chlorophyll synthase
MNDFLDQKVDTIKRNLYPNSGSLKTIPDGILPAKQLLIVGLIAGIFAVLISVIVEIEFDRNYFSVLGIFCLIIFLLYSGPPIRLNYLGGGEILEMLGVGLVLPYCNFYFQSGQFEIPYSYTLFTSSLLFALASAIASGLSDEVSDRKGGKKTCVTKFGNFHSKNLILFFSFTGSVILLLTPFYQPEILSWFEMIFFLGFNIFLLLNIFQLKKNAVTDAFLDIQKFKTKLHLLIWGNFIFVSILLFWKGLKVY